MAATLQRLADELAALTVELAKREGLPVPPSLTKRAPVRHTRANMSATPAAIGTLQSRPGRPSESKRPFVAWLAERGSSLTAWAEAHGLKYGRVKGWVSDDNPRRIPRDMADLIEAESMDPVTRIPAVPATLASWPQGIN